MALNQATLAGLYQKYLGRPLKDADIAALGGISGAWTKMNPDEFVKNTIIPSAEFQQKNPGQNDINVINATAAYKPLLTAAQDKYSAERALNDANFANTEKSIKERVKSSQEGLRSDLSSRGFLRSGEQVGTGVRIEEQGLKDINQAQINNAIANADLLLSEGNFEAGVYDKITGSASTAQQTAFSQQLATITNEQGLLLNDNFSNLLIDQPDLARQMLIQAGFTV